MASRRLEVVIAGDASGATRALGQLENRTERTQRAMSGFRRVGASLAGVFAGVQVGQFLRGAIEEAEEAQRVMAQTNAVIESTGGVAGISADHLNDLAGELSRLAAVDDEVIQQGGNLLLTFKEIKAEGGIFDGALAAALDMSSALGTQLQPQILAVGKALNDPIRGITRLERAGVSFTEAQREQIRVMAEAGDVAGAQRIILEELESQFGGAAEANATASQRMTVAWDNIKESVGLTLMPAFQTASDAVAVLAGWFEDLPDTTKNVVLAFAGVTTAALVMWAAVGAPAAIALAAIAGIGAAIWALAEAFPEAKKQAMIFFDSLPGRWAELQKDIQPVRDAIQSAVDRMREFFKSDAFQRMKDALQELGDTLAKFKEDIGLTGSTGTTAILILTSAFRFLGGMIYVVITAVTAAITQLSVMGNLTLSGVRFAVAVLAGFVQAVVSAAREAWSWLSRIDGMSVVVPGLGALHAILSAAAGAAQRLWSALSNFVNRTFRVNIDFPSPPAWLNPFESAAINQGVALGGGVAMLAPTPSRQPGVASTSIVVNVHGAASPSDGQAVVDALRRWSKTNGPVPVKVSA